MVLCQHVPGWTDINQKNIRMQGFLFEGKCCTFCLYSQHSFFLFHTCMHAPHARAHTHTHTHTHTMSVIVTLTEPFTMREKNGIAVHSKLKSSCQIIFCHPSTDTLHFFRWLQDLKTRWDKVWWPYIYMFRLWYFWNHLNYHVDEQLVVGDIGIKIMYYLH